MPPSAEWGPIEGGSNASWKGISTKSLCEWALIDFDQIHDRHMLIAFGMSAPVNGPQPPGQR